MAWKHILFSLHVGVLPQADARAERRLSARAGQLQPLLPQSVGVELCGALLVEFGTRQ